MDGLPLAIELAAARIKLFSPQALLTRLEKSLSVLGTGARDLPGRQQTLRGAIDWSYDLLDEPQQRLLNRFSVFARGGSAEQAEVVCGPPEEVGGDVLPGLDELADHSLLRRLPDFDEPRLLMLQTIREYAGERLQKSGEAEVIRDRHADAFCSLATTAAPNLFGDDSKAWLDRLELDHDNFRAALDWCVARDDADRAMGLAGSFWRFWQMRGHLHEGRMRLETILAMRGGDRNRDARARALEAAGGIAYWQGDMPAAIVFYDKCLDLRRAGDDRRELANAIYNASFPTMVDRRDLNRSQVLLEEALPVYRELADDAGISGCQWAIGNLLYFKANYGEAIPALDEAIELFRKAGNHFGLGWALHTRALCALRTDDVTGARSYVGEGLGLFSNAGDVTGIALMLDDASEVAMMEGDRSVALQLASAATAHQATSGTGLGNLLNLEERRSRREDVAGEADERAWTQGQAMTIEQAVALALGRRLATKEEG
jgi:tetratricopeptide (TPR) repeat protein